MRALLVAALVFTAALAGCSGKKGGDDDHLHYECPDGTEIHGEDYEGVMENVTIDFLKTKCPKGTGTGSKTNTTTLAPNVPPVVKLAVSDDGGNATNVTMLDGNLTFDATGSTDADGTIAAIAITVQDSNRSQTQSLYDLKSKKFTPATFKFDRAGIVNVSVSMIDDRAGFTTYKTNVYVNHPQEVDGSQISGPVEDTPLSDPCTGARGVLDDSHTIVDSQYFATRGFEVLPGATYIEAIPRAGSLVTICDPDGNAISSPAKSADPVTTTEPIVPPSGIAQYQIGFYADDVQVDTGALVIVHYEPRPAAAA